MCRIVKSIDYRGVRTFIFVKKTNFLINFYFIRFSIIITFKILIQIYHILLVHLNESDSDLSQSSSLGQRQLASSTNLVSLNQSSSIHSRVPDLNKLDLNNLMGRKRLGGFLSSTQSTVPSNIGLGSSNHTTFANNVLNSTNESSSTNCFTDHRPTESLARPCLFSFSNTSHSLGITSYLRENQMLVGFVSKNY